MSRKARWAPRLVPEVRRSMVTAVRAEADRLDRLASKVQAGMAGVRPMAQAATGLRGQADSLRRADLFWVTDEMARIAFDASADVPSIDAVDAPSTHGLICFQAPLPAWQPLPGLAATRARNADGSLRLDPVTQAVPIDGIAWDASDADTATLHLLVKPDRLPGPLSEIQSKHLVSLVEMTIPRQLDFADAELVDGSDGQVWEDGGATLSVAAFAASCWVLMMTPTMAQRRTLDSRTGAAATPATPSGLGVSIIDLRPLRYVEVDSEEGTGRRLTVRHVVRGHWTHQPHGPGRAERRLQWIAPYIKGPSWAPLLATDDRVMVWRRG